MSALASYVAGRWIPPEDNRTSIVSAVTGEPVAETGMTVRDFAAVLRHARTVGGPECSRQVALVNEQIARLDDSKSVRFLDINQRFLDGNGQFLDDVSPDGLHLTTRGYQIWSDAMQPLLTELMKDARAK